MHDEEFTELAAFVLGGLPPQREHAVRAHLMTCDLCLAELPELETAAGLLAEVEPTPAQDDLGLDHAVLVAGALRALEMMGDGPAGPENKANDDGARIADAIDDGSGARLVVRVAPEPGGIRVVAVGTCLGTGSGHHVAVVDGTGRTVGRWPLMSPSHDVHLVRLSAPIRLADVASARVEDGAGICLVTARLEVTPAAGAPRARSAAAAGRRAGDRAPSPPGRP